MTVEFKTVNSVMKSSLSSKGASAMYANWKPAVLAGMICLIAGGCSDFEASFSISDKTQSLAPEAQFGTGEQAPGVITLTEQKFGNPQSLNAWLKLPVNWGGTSVAVVSASADNSTVVVEPADEGGSLPDHVASLLTTDGTFVSVQRWNAETGEAVLATSEVELTEGQACTLDAGTGLQAGRVSYMRHCSHCHGTAGDGNGPTAQYLNPRPRDYRHGVFKFTSTNDLSRASRDDLTRILRYGIPGTYMPSFLLMEDEEMNAIIEYVRFLAMRGEFERKLVVELSADYSSEAMKSRIEGGETRAEIIEELTEFLTEDMADSVELAGDDLKETWEGAESDEAKVIPSVPRVPDSPESRRRGRELYLSKALNCADCHGIDGAGNGPQTIAFERNPTTNELYEEAGLHDVWDNLNQPRNLQSGIFRGGRRPIDIFCRVYSGIKGSRMPSFKNTPHEDIWHIVNYVLSVPFESEPGASGELASTSETAAAEAGD
jgi:mono/diheme cytochrome c family protein